MDIYMPERFDYWSAAGTFWLNLAMMSRDITENFSYTTLMY